jgi:hypothetical protein
MELRLFRSLALLLGAIGGAAAFRLPAMGAVGVRPGRSPALAMQEQNMAETATVAMDNLIGMLSDGVEPPSRMRALKGAVGEGDDAKITVALYSLMVEQTLDYDVTEDGKLVKSEARAQRRRRRRAAAAPPPPRRRRRCATPR